MSRSKLYMALLAIAFALGGPQGARAELCAQYSDYIHWLPLETYLDLPAHDLIVEGNLAYLFLSSLEIVDIANPAAPSLLAHLSGSNGKDMVKVGDLVLLSGLSGDAFRVIDVSDPANPLLLGSLALAGDALAAQGSLACMAGSSALYVIDFSDPAAPEQVGSLGLSNALLAAGEDYVYAASGAFLRTIELSDPAAPIANLVHTHTGTFKCIERSGDLLYAGVDPAGLLVFSLADPEAPALIGETALPHTPASLSAADDLLYATNAANRRLLDVVEVGDPAQPALLTSVFSPFDLFDVAATHDRIWFGGVGEGLEDAVQPAWLLALEPGNHAAPPIIGEYTDSALSSDFAIAPNRVYASHGTEQELLILDFTDPGAPALLGTRFLGFTPTRMAIHGDKLYIAAVNPLGLHVLDLADPDHPQPLGDYSLPDPYPDWYETSFAAMAVGDGRVYLTINGTLDAHGDDFGLLQVVDVSDPAHPVDGGSLRSLYDTVSALAISEDGALAYLGFGAIIRIIDLTTQPSPSLVGEIYPNLQLPPFPMALLATGDRLYAGLASAWGWGRGALTVFDVSDPEAPLRLFEQVLPYETNSLGLSADGGTLYGGCGTEGILSFAISPNEAPILLGMHTYPTVPLAAGPDFLLARSTEWRGLAALPLQCTATGLSELPSAVGGPRLSAHPNPFNPSSTIGFSLQAAQSVALTVHDIAGRQVRSLWQGRLDAGDHQLLFDGKDDTGRSLPSGIYLARLSVVGLEADAKLVLIK